MASVSSLDQDMRRLRLDRYTPAAADEIRAWIESTLGERLPSGDLLDVLKDGVALCRLANMVLPAPGIKYKVSNMPFTQRENISHFLTACERPPLDLPAHDRFLTVDLYDNKDPAQVVQCIGAFSRAANAALPSKFPTAIGPKRQASPTRSPGRTPTTSTAADSISRGASNASSMGGSVASAARSAPPTQPAKATGSSSITSWSSKSDELTSAPAWNIHQYGYMGGASQGNQGVSFGARRQIVAPDVNVPSLAEKEKRRREQEEQERLQLEAETRRQAEAEAQERQAKIEEEARWWEETRKAREREKQLAEEEKRKWEEEERKWKEDEERRRLELAETSTDVTTSNTLRGQYLSQYQSAQRTSSAAHDREPSQSDRIQDLERQLEEARERERQYQLERGGRSSRAREHTPEAADSSSYRRPASLSPSRKPTAPAPAPAPAPVPAPAPATPPPLSKDAWLPDDREQLRQQAVSPPEPPPSDSAAIPTAAPRAPQTTQAVEPPSQGTPQSSSALSGSAPPPQRPLPDPVKAAAAAASSPSPFARPLPDPVKAAAASSSSSSSPSPFTRPQAPSPFTRSASPPKTHAPAEMSLTSTAEQAAEDARRVASQAKTRAGGLASKSLMEREMERERERQREWEQNQMLRASQQQSGANGPPSRVLGPRDPQQQR